MAQLNLYIDDQLIKKITRIAKKQKLSVSGWVKQKLEEVLADSWPSDYFKLFGSLKDLDIERSPQPKYVHDSKRESL